MLSAEPLETEMPETEVRRQARSALLSRLFAPPALPQKRANAGKPKRVAIIGAGLAGLTAAYELEALGHEPVILEAGSRVGGRIYTRHFGDGLHGEFGAMRIPAHHTSVLRYVRAFGLPTRKAISHNPMAFYHIDGVRTRIGKASSLWPAQTPAAFLGQDPAQVQADLVEALLDELDAGEIAELIKGEGRSSRLAKIDRMTYLDYFADKLPQVVCSLVAKASGVAHYNRVSCLSGLVDELNWACDDHLELVRGMDSLVDGFTDRLKAPIRFNAPITAIALEPDGISLSVGDTALPVRADYALCCIPAPEVVKIRFSPAGSANQAVINSRMNPPPCREAS